MPRIAMVHLQHATLLLLLPLLPVRFSVSQPQLGKYKLTTDTSDTYTCFSVLSSWGRHCMVKQMQGPVHGDHRGMSKRTVLAPKHEGMQSRLRLSEKVYSHCQ